MNLVIFVIVLVCLAMVFVWKVREDIREEMRICRRMQNECFRTYETMTNVIDTQRNHIRGWEHKIFIMDTDIRKLKKAVFTKVEDTE